MKRPPFYKLLLPALVAGALGCVMPPPAVPGPEDVARAQERFPGATLQTLALGRAAYLTNCSGCHHLYPARKHTPEEWARMLPEMAKRAKLAPDQEELILRYLASMSAQPRSDLAISAGASRVSAP